MIYQAVGLDRKKHACACFFLAGIVGLEPTKCKSQSLVPSPTWLYPNIYVTHGHIGYYITTLWACQVFLHFFLPHFHSPPSWLFRHGMLSYSHPRPSDKRQHGAVSSRESTVQIRRSSHCRHKGCHLLSRKAYRLEVGIHSSGNGRKRPACDAFFVRRF